jgi:hypothetical protein
MLLRPRPQEGKTPQPARSNLTCFSHPAGRRGRATSNDKGTVELNEPAPPSRFLGEALKPTTVANDVQRIFGDALAACRLRRSTSSSTSASIPRS